MHNSLFAILFFILLFVFGCQSKYPKASLRRQNDEAKAEMYLKEARAALIVGDVEAAEMQIQTLRDSCRYALEAREQALLLMDSIDLFAAGKELQKMDSLIRRTRPQAIPQEQKDKYNDLFRKVKFYQRKLQHDKQQRKHYD